MSELPDIYADDFAVTVHGNGVVLTCRRANSVTDEGPGVAVPEVCGRIRMTHASAQGLVEALGRLLAQAQATSQAAEQAAKIKH